MKREFLKKHLLEQLEKYSQFSYEQFANLSEGINEHYGEPTDNNEDFYQVSVRVLEQISTESETYILVSISVDDGRGGFLGGVKPEVGALVFYKDGRIEKVIR
jgi:hypothetical protein